MSLIDIGISALKSRRMRSRIVGAGKLMRTIEPPDELDQKPGFFSKLLGGFFGNILKLGGWILGTLGKRLQFSFTTIWSLICSTVSFVYRFNWNATDVDLDRQLNSVKQLVASQLGGTLGNLTGYLVCGIIPAAAVFTFNEALGLYMLANVGEEALDELLSNIQLLTSLAAQGAAKAFVISTYKNIRRSLKLYFKDPSSKQSKLMQNLFGGGFNKAVKAWGEESSKPWSFAIAVENAIESIKNPSLQAFVEEFYDEALDACYEAGYIAAQSIDSYIMQQKQAKIALLGKERVVEITPDREAPEETIIMTGSEAILKPAMVTMMSTHQMIENRDIGQFVGENVKNAVRKAPSQLSLKIVFYNNSEPPWYRGGKEPKSPTYTIPGVKRTKCDWNTIKLACGGKNGYMWGRFCAVARLNNDDDVFAGQMKVYGASEGEAQDRLLALHSLSDYKITSLTVTEEKKEGKRKTNPKLYKEATQIYPAYFTIINSLKVHDEDEGRSTLQGTYRRKRERIQLWTDDEPFDAQEVINELLSNKRQL